MSSFLAALLSLLIPILAILIVRVRTRQRLQFPHTYLRSLRDRPFQEFLLRTFQLYSDVAFDLLLALLLALMMSGHLDLSPRRTAVCLDGSYSMGRGAPDSPLERALSILARGELGPPGAERYRLFVLGFDPRSGKPALTALGRVGNEDLPRLRARLRKAAPRFFSADPRALARLFRRGYSRVIFLTDRPPPETAGLEVVDLGGAQGSFFYPYSAAYDPREQAFRVRFLRFRYDQPIGIMKFSEEEGEYQKLSIEEKGIPGSPLSELLLREPGLYRFYASGAAEGLDFLLHLVPPQLQVDPRGQYSGLLADLLPGVRKGSDGILMADLPWRSGDRRFPRGAARGLHGILTVVPDPGLEPAVRPFLQPLTESFSLPCYSELPSELDRVGAPGDRVFYFDPRGVRDERTPLVYLSALAKLGSGGEHPHGARFSPARSGSASYAYAASSGLVTLNLPPEEFFPLPFEQDLVLPAPVPAPLPCVALLLLPYALKTLFLLRLHRRGAQARTAAPVGRRRPGRG